MLYSATKVADARKVADSDNIYATIEPQAYLSLRKSTSEPQQYTAIRTSVTPAESKYSGIDKTRTQTKTEAVQSNTEGEYAAIADDSPPYMALNVGEYLTFSENPPDNSMQSESMETKSRFTLPGLSKGSVACGKGPSTTYTPKAKHTITARTTSRTTPEWEMKQNLTAELMEKQLERSASIKKPPALKPKPKLKETKSIANFQVNLCYITTYLNFISSYCCQFPNIFSAFTCFTG